MRIKPAAGSCYDQALGGGSGEAVVELGSLAHLGLGPPHRQNLDVDEWLLARGHMGVPRVCRHHDEVAHRSNEFLAIDVKSPGALDDEEQLCAGVAMLLAAATLGISRDCNRQRPEVVFVAVKDLSVAPRSVFKPWHL